MKKGNWKTTLVSLAIAIFFLILAFRGTDLNSMIEPLSHVSPMMITWVVLGVILGTIIRGWRWWFTLPAPRSLHELMSFQRAIGVCYAANNFIPRSGEVLRILMAKRDTERSAAMVSSTVILDRFLLDLLGLIGVLITAFMINAKLLSGLFEYAAQTLVLLIILAGVGFAGLLFLASAPGFFMSCLKKIGLERLPKLFAMISRLVEEMSLGLASLKNFRSVSVVLFQTILMWFIYMVVFKWGLIAFHIDASPAQTALAFSISMLGIVFPSPGGIGTYHFFAKTALVAVFSVDDQHALAMATFLHSVMFLTNSLYGLICLGIPLKKRP